MEKASYLSGKWEDLSKEVEKGSFDVILMAEVLYNKDYYPSLMELITHSLNPRTGLVLCGTKTYYFGVGGG
jgi:hypothetical protein